MLDNKADIEKISVEIAEAYGYLKSHLADNVPPEAVMQGAVAAVLSLRKDERGRVAWASSPAPSPTGKRDPGPELLDGTSIAVDATVERIVTKSRNGQNLMTKKKKPYIRILLSTGQWLSVFSQSQIDSVSYAKNKGEKLRYTITRNGEYLNLDQVEAIT